MSSLARITRKTDQRDVSRSPKTGMLAAAWGVIFAIPHILWGMGWFRESLRFSLNLRPGPREERLIDNPAFVAAGLWGVAGLSLIATLIALATFRPWEHRLPRWVPIAGAWGVCAVLAIRSLVMPGILGSIAVETGLVSIGEDSDPAWYRWNIILWSPWFLAGAYLFGRTALDATARDPLNRR